MPPSAKERRAVPRSAVGTTAVSNRVPSPPSLNSAYASRAAATRSSFHQSTSSSASEDALETPADLYRAFRHGERAELYRVRGELMECKGDLLRGIHVRLDRRAAERDPVAIREEHQS
jgi:hypothetical protein